MTPLGFKKCRQCLTVKPHSEFYSFLSNETNKKRLCSRCKPCDSNYPGHYRSVKKSNGKYPRKTKNRFLLARLIRQGKIVRPLNCSRCFKVCKPHGHHPDHRKPLLLVWLCSQCHTQEHRKQKLEPGGRE